MPLSDVFTVQHKFGTVTGTTAVSPFPDVPCQQVRFQAAAGNYTVVKIGDSITNAVWELSPGEEVDFFPVPNLNRFYLSAVSGVHEKLAYWLMN